MRDKLDYIFTKLNDIGCKIYWDEPMSKHTSFKIGGPADLYIMTDNQEQTALVISLCNELSVPCHIVGKGSNILVSDEGIRGVVLRPCTAVDDIRIVDDGLIEAGAGVSLSALCTFALEHSYCGLEFAWGIPGSIGGALYMNAGAYGGEIKDKVVSAVHLDKEGNPHELTIEEMKLSYRHSIYAENGGIITSIRFYLTLGDPALIKANMDDIAMRRRTKQPLEYPSGGSTFKRPPGYFAGSLIEQCGLKGVRIGGAEVSKKHAGFIINVGGATCSDVLALVEHIQKTVLNQTGVELICEIKRM